MKTTRKLSRRSFLTRVAGGAIAGGGALAMASGAAAHPISDSDASDAAGAGSSTERWPHADGDRGASADPVGRAGRLGHFTDSDAGPEGDPANHGRRVSDADPGDPQGRRPSISDNDVGPDADQVSRGRRPPRR